MQWAKAQDLGLEGQGAYVLDGRIPPRPRVAVVGSRAAHKSLRRAVPWVVEAAMRAGWSVVSGGAVGIDGDAHRAALAAAVPQLAVLPLGPDAPYPAQHQPLFAAIAAAPSSGVVFGLPPGGVVTRRVFASRNRLVVGAAQAVVVIEAAARSGSVGTGRLALRAGTALAAVAGSPGAAALIASGARALDFGSGSDALVEQTEAFLRGQPAPDRPTAWPGELAWLRARFEGAGRISLDDCGDPACAATALLEAETLGLILEAAPGQFVKVRD